MSVSQTATFPDVVARLLGGALLPGLAGIAQQIEGTENGPACSITLLYQQVPTASDVPQDFGHAELASQVRAHQVDNLSCVLRRSPPPLPELG